VLTEDTDEKVAFKHGSTLEYLMELTRKIGEKSVAGVHT
jgi:hypothetical protein